MIHAIPLLLYLVCGSETTGYIILMEFYRASGSHPCKVTPWKGAITLRGAAGAQHLQLRDT